MGWIWDYSDPGRGSDGWAFFGIDPTTDDNAPCDIHRFDGEGVSQLLGVHLRVFVRAGGESSFHGFKVPC